VPFNRFLSNLLMLAPFVFFLAGCGGGGGSEFDQVQQAKASVADQLKARGAQVTPKVYPGFGEGLVVSYPAATVDDEFISCLQQLQHVSELDLSKSTLDDAQLDRVAKACGALTSLDVSNTSVSDTGLNSLNDLGLLLNLNVAGTKVTAEGIKQFKAKRRDDSRIRQMFKDTKVKS
jgi:hypothetical protein